MTRNLMLAGMSVVAFAASAGAQNGQNNGDTSNAQTGNRVVISCTVGNPANNCSVTQNAGTFDSTGSVNANGNGNTSTVNQTGNRQLAENRAVGDRNSASATQNGFANTALISQTGTIAAGNTANVATVSQGRSGNPSVGDNNFAQIVQARTAGAATAAEGNDSYIFQAFSQGGGSNNRATSTQNGTGLRSGIDQYITNDGVAASNNSATVLQTGRGGVASTGTQSFVQQARSGNVANVALFDGGLGAALNTSDVRQTNTAFVTGTGGALFASGAPTTATSPNTGNNAIVVITGSGNDSSVAQNGVQNTVDVSLLNGGAGNTAQADSGTNPGTGASLLPNQGGQPNNRRQGNSSAVIQFGRGNYAAVSSGGRVSRSDGTMSGGAGNLSSITQSQGDAAVSATTLNSVQTAATAHRALVYQRGTLDSVTIQQLNNTSGGVGRNQTQSGSLADVAQLSFNSTTSISQTGTNTARVTQGARNEPTGSDNRTIISQSDQGDVTTTSGANPGSGFGGGAAGTTAGSSANFGEVVQYGIQNNALVVQSATNASVTIFQAVGTRQGTANVYQNGLAFGATSAQQQTANTAAANVGANLRNVTVAVNQTAGLGNGVAITQSGQNLNVTVNQQGGTAQAGTNAGTPSNNGATIAQAYANNNAALSQNGTGLGATIEQRGTGSTALRNTVRVDQSNSTGAGTNVASAVQTQNVGASVAGDATAGVPNDVNFPFSRSGANAAEIVIAQSGTGGSATVEQRGKGQYASITQTGTNNTGGILQNAAATNAVAVLTQNGTDNTFYIQQDVAGQYIRVTQSGTGNTAAGTSIINGPSGSGNSNAATPQTRPTFGGVQ